MPVAFETHPYGEYFPKKCRLMIIGSFPIGKFTNPKRRKEILSHEYDFFFGGEKNLLWKLLSEVYGHPVRNVEDIKELLEKEGIAIGDVIKGCRRKNSRAADSDLYDIDWNVKLLEKIRSKKIQMIYFTSKRVEGWFNQLFPETLDLKKITLISPSGQSVRSIGRHPEYKEWKENNPDRKAVDFILLSYCQKLRPHHKKSP